MNRNEHRLFPMTSPAAPLFAVAADILLLYIIYFVCRIEYLVLNWQYFADGMDTFHFLRLMWAGAVFDTPGIFYTNALWVLMMLFPVHAKERHGWQTACKWVFVVVNTVAVVMNLGDSVYFGYTLKRTAWSVFGEFGTGNELGKVLGIELLRHWYLVALAALLVWGMWKLYVMPRVDLRRTGLAAYYAVAVVGLVIAGVTVVAGIRGGFLNHWYNYIFALAAGYVGWHMAHDPRSRAARSAGWTLMVLALCSVASAPIGGWRHRDIRPVAISNANAWTSRPAETALVLNTPFTMIRSIGNVPFHKPGYFADDESLAAVYTPVQRASATPAAGGKNICVIIIESFGREYIGAMNRDILGPDYKGYTPFTDSLLNHTAWWRWSLDNGHKSIDAMPSILASIPMFVRPFIVTPQAVNHLKGLPALLGEKGYDSAFFHGARTGSMGFDGFANSIGFKRYYGREDFEKDPRFGGIDDFDGYWAIWDEPFMKWFALKITEMKQPFVSAVFTASNHHPFRIPAKYEGQFPEGTMPIHRTAGYTDMALREFFAVAKTQPWYGNTIFVITNDHTNMRDHDEYRSAIGSFYGPVLIFDPSGTIAPGEREGIVQQTDIMPTLLNLTGYDKPFVAFGIDILNTPADDTWAVNYNEGVYQYIRNGLVLQFDGTRTVGLYRLGDHKMEHDLKGTLPQQAQMETELKAVIQQYMDRMLDDRLTEQ